MDADGVDLDFALTQLYGGVPEGTRIDKLRGDASTRSYYRVHVPEAAAPDGPRTLIAMRLPEDAMGSDEGTSGERPSELPFVDVQRLLASRGIRVPEIYVDAADRRVLLLEDLGDETFGARLQTLPPERWAEQYGHAIELLARMHEACALEHATDSIAYTRRFDRALLRWELDHFREWGVEAPYGALAPDVRGSLDRELERLTDDVAALPQGFVHRDYQSRNLMWLPDGALCVIDFQDALVGPACYDLVALLCDSYVAFDRALQQTLIARYADARGMSAAEADALARAFWMVAAQRKLKDAGRFVFIDRVRGNPDFLRWYPRSLTYVARALDALGDRGALQRLLGELVPGFPDAVSVPDVATGSAAQG